MAEYICRVSLGVPLITHVRWSASRFGVAGQAGVEEAQPLFLADRFDAGAYLLRRLAHSAGRQLVAQEQRVAHPQHLVVYRIGPDGIAEIMGLAHDRMLLGRAARWMQRRTTEK